MDPQVQTSFIPKKSFDTGAVPGGSAFGLFFLVALLIFIASLVAAGGSFLYTQYLQSSLAAKAQQLQLAENAFDPSAIADLVRLDSRINQAQTLLNKHTAASAVFAFLSQQTLQNVSWNSFTYTLADDGTAAMVLTGTADSFATVALQSDQFGGNKLLKNVVFSAISISNTGGISFTVNANIDPSLILYSNVIGGSAAPAPSTTTTTQAGSSTPITP